MKKIFLLSLILVSLTAFGQTVPGFTSMPSRYNWINGTLLKGGANIPSGVSPTFPTGSTSIAGWLYVDTSGTTDTGLYYWHGGWVKVGTGTVTSASNGLTLVGSDVQLGGSLTKADTILLNNFALNVRYDDSNYVQFTKFGTNRTFRMELDKLNSTTSRNYSSFTWNNTSFNSISRYYENPSTLRATAQAQWFANNTSGGNGGITLEGLTDNGARVGIDGDAYYDAGTNSNVIYHAFQTGSYNAVYLDTTGVNLLSGTSSLDAKGLRLKRNKSIIIDTAYRTLDSTGFDVLIRNRSSGYVHTIPSNLLGGGAGTVTSVSAGYGMNFTTITTTGSVIADSSVLMTKGTTQVVSGGKIYSANQVFNAQHATNRITLGSVSGQEQYPGIWMTSAAISLTNYAFLADISAGVNYVNGPNGSGLRVSNSDVLRATSTGVGIFATSTSAALHIIRTTEQQRTGYDASNYYSTTVSSTGGVTFNAVGSGSAFSFSDNISAPNLTSGTTTPTLTGVVNISSTSTSALKYVRYGNIVSYTGFFIVTPTAAGTANFDFSLPIASNFASSGDLFGTCNVTSVTGGDGQSGYGLAETTNDRGSVRFTAAANEANTIIISGHYIIN